MRRKIKVKAISKNKKITTFEIASLIVDVITALIALINLIKEW